METPNLSEILQLAWPTPWLVIAIALGLAIYFGINEIGKANNWTGLQPVAVQLVLVVFISFSYFAFGSGLHTAVVAFIWMIAFPRLAKLTVIGIWVAITWAWEFLGNHR